MLGGALAGEGAPEVQASSHVWGAPAVLAGDKGRGDGPSRPGALYSSAASRLPSTESPSPVASHSKATLLGQGGSEVN